MIVKCAYYLKLFSIIATTTVLLASVETAPDHPVFFALVLTFVLVANRKLWRSALKTEGEMSKGKIGNRKRTDPDNITIQTKKKAA